MYESVNSKLTALLSCAECGGSLEEKERFLICVSCGTKYEIEDGIPLLYPEDMDRSHMEEEENLGDIMKDPVGGMGENFSKEQWKISKQEFWNRVKEQCAGITTGNFINIGCGIDIGFLELALESRTLVGFDLMPDLLKFLREKHGLNNVVAGTVHTLPFHIDSFDCLCSIDLIHHEWNNIRNILHSFQKILKPGGWLFLEDINAWGLFQFHKSVLLPKPLHGRLRSLYHGMKRSSETPAEYEFPTSVFRTARVLRNLGFRSISVTPLKSYPNIGPARYRIYKTLSKSEHIQKYHNFHYMIAARKGVL